MKNLSQILVLSMLSLSFGTVHGSNNKPVDPSLTSIKILSGIGLSAAERYAIAKQYNDQLEQQYLAIIKARQDEREKARLATDASEYQGK